MKLQKLFIQYSLKRNLFYGPVAGDFLSTYPAGLPEDGAKGGRAPTEHLARVLCQCVHAYRALATITHLQKYTNIYKYT